MPFSDPVADGTVISMASQRAITNQTTLLNVLEVAKKLRQESEIPMILFTYFNPLFNYFDQDIFTKIKNAGIDGVLVVDLPVHESKLYRQHCITASLAPVYVITQATSNERIQAISKQGKGFLYYACRSGTTGIKKDIPDDLSFQIQRIKQLTHLPVVVGFGISTPQQSAAICEVADGFVVGSLFVDAIANNITSQELSRLARKLIPSPHFRNQNHEE